MKGLVVVLTLLVSILGVISKDLSSTENDVKFEEQEKLADGDILDLVSDRHKQPVCRKWKSCCQKHRGQEKHHGLVVTGGDNPNRIAVSEQISTMGVCVSPDTNIPDLTVATAGAKSTWIQDSKTLMFCGGSDTFEGHDTPYPDGWGAMDTCWKVKPGDIDWQSEDESKMKKKRSWFSMNNINAKEVVAAGGMTTDGYLLDSMEKYSNGKWKILKATRGSKKGKEIKLTKKTYGHCAVQLQYTPGRYDILMTIGGSNNKDTFWDATNEVTKYNLNTGRIDLLEPGELTVMWAPACTIKGSDIYVSGGGDDNHNAFTAVYKGSNQGKFKKIGDLQKPRWGHTMGMPSNGLLFITGGYDPATSIYINEIESSVKNSDEEVGVTWNTLTTTLTAGGEYAAMASVPAFTFTCQ